MMMRPMLVNCSNCQTPLQLPAGAVAIRCTLWQAVTHVADPRNAPAPPSPSHSSSFSQPHAPPPPSPYSHAPPSPPPNAHGRKKAVIVGISYRYLRHELKGFHPHVFPPHLNNVTRNLLTNES